MGDLRQPAAIADVFDAALEHRPEAEALVTRSARLSYRELDALADRAAHALAALGVRPGDRVAASLPNDVDVVAAFHGAMRLGAVWVGVNQALAPPERAYIVDDAGASLVLDVDRLDEWRSAVAAAPAGRVDAPAVDPLAPAGIAYTSGTTGRPKGAVHSQHNLLVPGAVLVASRGWGPDLRKGDCLPLTILNMVVLTTLLVAQAEGCCIVMDRVDPEGIAGWLRDERVGVWNGPPAMLHGLATRDDVLPSDLGSLHEVWVGGADCPASVRDRFTAKFGCPVVGTYGLSEAPTIVTIERNGVAHAEGSSGVALAHLDVQILDDAGAPVAAGDTGEICVAAVESGPWAGTYRQMLGYWGKPEPTAHTLRGGHLHTGDVGFLDDAGELHVRDRLNLVILRGGANVYPAEVERVLHELPGIDGCAVVGVPDDRLGERVVAVVQLATGTALDGEALRAHCVERLARYKVPERFVVVDVLPRNAMGKVSRPALASLVARPAEA